MAEQRQCIIGKGMTVRGNVTGAEDLMIAGKVEGKVKLAHHLHVATGAIVKADLEVEELTVEGTLEGNVLASRGIRIQNAAQVTGNIKSPRIVIEEGARFRGQVEMNFQLPNNVRK